MVKKAENKSLFLYTALIFIVAILIILLAFFGQSNMQSQQPEVSPSVSAGGGITESAARLSEENRILLEQVRAYEQKNAALEQENQDLKTANTAVQQLNAINEKLISIYMSIYNEDYDAANQALAEIAPETLTSAQKEFYDILLIKTKN